MLDRALVDKRIWPAIDIGKTGTRREEMLLDPEELRRVTALSPRRCRNESTRCHGTHRQSIVQDQEQRRVLNEPQDELKAIMIETMQGDTGPVQGTIGIVVSRYNDSITGKLLQGAIDTLRGAGLGEKDIVVAWVSGHGSSRGTDALFHERNCEGVIALWAVIRGETTHDQHINRAVVRA